MKGKLKQTKGITLIALIITIIVLLILAVVSMRLVVNNGILGKAESGVNTYSESETEEKIKLAYSDYQMGKLTDSGYTFEQALQNGKVAYTSVTGSDAEGYIVTTTLSDGTEKKFNVTSTGVSKIKDLEDYGLQIGDYVAYDEGTGYSTTIETNESGYTSSQTKSTENLGWRVLGVNEKGELELISNNPTTQKLSLFGETGYLNGENVLNDMCNELYGNGTGSTGKVVASSARCLNVDDINKLGNYDPSTSGGYGMEWTYRYPTQAEMDEFTGSENSTRYMQYSINGGTTWKNIKDSSCQTFRMPGESETIGKISDTEIKEGSRNVKYTNYSYSISNYVKQTTSEGKGMADIITKGSGKINIDQWLASTYNECDSESAMFGMRFVENGWVYRFGGFYYSKGKSYGTSYSVRPVVTLKCNIQVEKTETKDGSTSAKACIIK